MTDQNTTSPAHGSRPPQTPLVVERRDGGLAWLTLNRPAQRNSLSLKLMAALQAALDALDHDPGVRVVIIGGSGPAFCAGHDLRELSEARLGADGGRAFFEQTFAQCAALMQTIVNLSKPVIARVHGVATAAGCQLVASCDLAVAEADARFATPGVNIGLFCSTPMVALARNVGRKAAMEMLLTGEPIDAPAARAMGLVNRVVAADGLDDECRRLGHLIAAKSAPTVRTGKAAFYRQLEMPLVEAYAYTGRVMVENMLTADAREGINAFLERRLPVWRDQ